LRTLRNIEAHKTPMSGHHNYWLVLLSVIVSITASYVALPLE
jgi:NO-binding membrane sensor protein with MHYT domain